MFTKNTVVLKHAKLSNYQTVVMILLMHTRTKSIDGI